MFDWLAYYVDIVIEDELPRINMYLVANATVTAAALIYFAS